MVSELRVVVADDHQLTLSGVADSLSMNGVSIVGRARNPRDAIALRPGVARRDAPPTDASQSLQQHSH